MDEAEPIQEFEESATEDEIWKCIAQHGENDCYAECAECGTTLNTDLTGRKR